MSMTPTIGRVVHYFPRETAANMRMHTSCGTEPMAAVVAYVHDEHKINLTVFDHHGFSHAVQGVRLIAPGRPNPQNGAYATWMAYQVKKATEGDHNSESAEPRPDAPVEAGATKGGDS